MSRWPSPPQTPTFAPGTFNLTGYVDYLNSIPGKETLTISPVSGVPEPGVWAMMLMGLGAVGGWLRSAKRKRAARAAAARLRAALKQIYQISTGVAALPVSGEQT